MAQGALAIEAPRVRIRAARRLGPAARAWLLLLPSIFFLCLFTYWPIVQVLLQSLRIETFGSDSVSYGLGNFERLFADADFSGALINNGLYAVGTIVPSIVLALALAVGLQEATRLNALLRTVVFFPVLLPLVAAAALFLFVFLPGIGLLDYYLAKLGAGQTNWLGDPGIALWSLVGLTVWKNAGYYMLFFLAGLQAIPQDLYEAARIEGAGAWARFRRITLPLLGPSLAFVSVIALVNVITQVDHVVVLTKGGPSGSTNLLLFYIYQTAHESYDYGKAAAATVVSVTLLLGLSFVSLRTLERGVHYEAA
ncbi:carbohydrate ABC transporter membrane protein 1, CUT1 family [Tistlia consotensis]|uniref:Carbohydrate ABC transporter membrane protein 1, CUT1 family n=1 Tax=Tistlia consotensis USBA 355 TaxID=560819 RepID=A0A1Y6B4K8_9PROT|nr:sugar ABC transporter permease [Tistlia consotensis]SME89815.1 carbohydrate ABC transporter membrane protein 1, CUT1 family [Tistlia consotensis USBA 355]SNR26328.1 carbohydrate ABC transporter membrane protein 1, CUT1 family [Tistlia consotensis]